MHSKFTVSNPVYWKFRINQRAGIKFQDCESWWSRIIWQDCINLDEFVCFWPCFNSFLANSWTRTMPNCWFILLSFVNFISFSNSHSINSLPYFYWSEKSIFINSFVCLYIHFICTYCTLIISPNINPIHVIYQIKEKFLPYKDIYPVIHAWMNTYLTKTRSQIKIDHKHNGKT